MSKKDLYHEHVKEALIKDGWTITDEPLYLELDEEELKVDFGAEKLISASKGGDIIAVEVKSFHNISAIIELQRAIGQLSMYEDAIKIENLGRELYLAISQDVYNSLINRLFFNRMLKKHNISIVIFNHKDRSIVEWIK